MRKPGPKVRSCDIADIAYVSELRNCAVRAIRRDYSHVLSDPILHKRIVTFLFSCYMAAPAPELRISAEFWKAYRHMIEGGSILDFPFTLLDKEYVVAQLRKILRGDPITLDEDENDDD